MKHEISKIGLFFVCILCLASCGNKADKGNEGKKTKDGKQIIETGELAAVYTKSFILPRFSRYFYEMRVIGILEHGAIVKAGDSIIQLDPMDVKKFILDRESDLETQKASFEKMLVDQANGVSDSESRIKNENASFDLKKIELESSRFESERQRKIKQLEFEQAELTLAKEKRKFELSKVIYANDLKIQQIRVKQRENEIKSAYNILPMLTFRTPISGVFQIAQNWRMGGGLVKVGDNIYPGQNLANVPDLKWMKVNTYINENDFLKIRLGQKVAVRLDAMPKVTFDGEISYIGKLCHLKDPKSRQKVFDVEVNLTQPDERLKPGMTVSCEYLQTN